jgi:hypothetical protein
VTTPRFDAFTTALVAAMNASANIGVAGIPVYDGPTVSSNQDATSIIVGGSFNDEDTDAGSFSLDWRTDGGASATQDETIQVNCAVQFWNGDADVAAARAGAFTVLGYVDTLIRSNVSLGVTALLWCHITTGSVKQELRSGAICIVEFTITARAII